MTFDFEISRVDCISKENYFSYFNIKNISQSPFPHFLSARKTSSAKSTSMRMVYENRSILSPSIQLMIHSLRHVDHLTGGLH